MNYSYAIGAFVTIELLENKAQYVEEVFLSYDIKEELKNKIIALCNGNNTRCSFNDKAIHKISGKDNVFVMGKFRKYESALTNENHIILDNPSNFGNIGTIMRSAVAFNFKNIVFIGNFADYFNPKVVRSSMGSIFHLNVTSYATIQEYIKEHKTHTLYSFMLDGKQRLDQLEQFKKPYSLIFGNEASGLDSSYHKISHSLRINTTDDVDSLNITSAVTIALYSAFINS